VPVGLISSSKGGTNIEQWTTSESNSGVRYNGMIAPLKPYAIRGVVWYQGKANVGNGLQYADKMKALVEGWRQDWGSDFPFYFAQLPSYSYKPALLPPIWEAQAASLKIPNTGMVVTTDVANIRNVHTKNKFDVGNRLALWALAKDYKKDLVYSGPLYKSMTVKGNKVQLTVAHVGGGLRLPIPATILMTPAKAALPQGLAFMARGGGSGMPQFGQVSLPLKLSAHILCIRSFLPPRNLLIRYQRNTFIGGMTPLECRRTALGSPFRSRHRTKRAVDQALWLRISWFSQPNISTFHGS
jgi:hypothetical protein